MTFPPYSTYKPNTGSVTFVIVDNMQKDERSVGKPKRKKATHFPAQTGLRMGKITEIQLDNCMYETERTLIASESVGVGDAAGPKIVKPPPSTLGFASTTEEEIIGLASRFVE